MRRPLCPDCQAASDRWLDYRLPPAPIRLISVGRPVSRVDEWRETINSQQSIIRGICERKHSVT